MRNYIYESTRYHMSLETQQLYSSLDKREDQALRNSRMEGILQNQAGKASRGLTKSKQGH